ncbi:MAG: peptidoglycan DD-metalloendopeptidase family protein [Candidatus Aminicenantes bacterium]|nr:peptidoglycan DD-metalloendopeptidase family protein [Candidatus Aminicenantes bacterium]NIM82012.1 peptidoglycan DD-metalloendopeptidase family protein [Candidatus Aminicenantes bacterium]NIN22342.1 peptidoglycan DD-metalloendopeptidase family protein [Candidatus Aminicenantes bacterium]NIN45223.1 peptidoglycan DD-metalloendopeptidase family protein [Candidatus Aminicenantes bacterium]NIN88043.1 peptidoglycan DD-metalloendopeptidase family protein [Candidatus Aminicenantes bacterium]
MNHSKEVVRILRSQRGALKPVLPFDLTKTAPVLFDLSARSRELEGIDLNDVEMFSDYIFAELRRRGIPVGVGRYAEDRVVYRHRSLFDGEKENRSIHLGIDIFVEPGTSISTPLWAEVHSFANNQSLGDYGPTIILRHEPEGVTFFTLYGHLSLRSLTGMHPGRRFAAGEVFARVGESQENGGWPPHLHFQIITDMGQWRGDFPGVAAPSQLKKYLELCPDPNLILCIPELEKEH